MKSKKFPNGTTHIKKRHPLGDGAIRVSGETAFFHFENSWQPCANLTAKDVTGDPNIFIPIKDYN